MKSISVLRLRVAYASTAVVRLLTLFFVCAFVAVSATDASAGDAGKEQQIRAVVRFVPDGDTLVLAHGEVVRLLGIDAPEMGKNGASDQFYAAKARALLASMVLGNIVIVRPSSPSKDRYGRTLAEVMLPGGENVNEILVSEGAAMVYYHDDLPEGYFNSLLALQRRALKIRIGMWQVLKSMNTGGALYVANRRSMRLFTPSCDGAGRIARKNRVEFSSIDEAFAFGYSPARHCGIWPDQ
ncbi:thermonuclease family protein [Desulfovibrio mangrovi]|uniref:thermonuclease family protein n=1 Tax=Desulfovibrio mangrovi TaxID=2976983 RepID=UPI0022481B66|nr:thermonuclease family protein [Desulfovibrio mangrovi]UZP68382.1 thermonuclease family protein [Desulfovibrio mangrovi]